MARRILLLVTDLEIGGTPTVVRELATRLRSPDVHVEVASLKTIGPVGAMLHVAGVEVTAMHAASALSLPAVAVRVRRLIRDRQIDTVVSFLLHANAVAALAVPRGVRLIESIQTTQPTPKWHWHVQQWAARSAERVLAPSPSIVAIAGERSSIAPERFEVIPNAIDPADFLRSPWPQESPSPYPVGFIGRLDPVKRVPDLLAAAKKIGSRVKLDIFGDGSARSQLQIPADGTVTLHGSIPQPQSALHEMGLLVLPSEAEGFGLVLIEAMAAGVPVIGTNVPGIRDVIDDEVNGLLVPAGDPDALAKAITRIIDDRTLRQQLIEGGLRSVRERYTWEIVLPRYRRLLELPD